MKQVSPRALRRAKKLPRTAQDDATGVTKGLHLAAYLAIKNECSEVEFAVLAAQVFSIIKSHMDSKA
jgi:hypothetical protein